jgi:hypothetical protein
MPRAEDQSIPAVDLADYLKTFAPTTYDTNHYGKHPEQRDLIQGIRTFKPGGTDDPSADQLTQQGIFKTCANGFKAMPANEKAAYFQAAIGSGMNFYDFQMQRNMNAVIAGTPYADLQHPNACRYDYDNNPSCAYMEVQSPIAAGGYFRWNIERDAGDFANGCIQPIAWAFQIAIFMQSWNNGIPSRTLWQWKEIPVGRSTGYWYCVPFAGPPPFNRAVRISRSSNTQSRFIVWDLSFEGVVNDLVLDGFLK